MNKNVNVTIEEIRTAVEKSISFSKRGAKTKLLRARKLLAQINNGGEISTKLVEINPFRDMSDAERASHSDYINRKSDQNSMEEMEFQNN